MILKNLFLKIIIAILFLLSFADFTYSQDEFEMKFGDTTYIMKKYVFGMYKRGPNKDLDSAQLSKIQEGHMNHLSEMSKTGKLLIAGPIDGKSDLRGLMIFNVKDINEAEELIKEDPAVKIGRLVYELYYWWTAKGSILK